VFVTLNATTATRIDLYEEYKNEAGGRAFRRKGQSLTLQPGLNEIPDDFGKEYFASEYNKAGGLVTRHDEGKNENGRD